MQTALTKTYAAWSRVRRADDPVAYVHGVLIKTFLSDRRRRWRGEVPHDEVPDRPGSATTRRTPRSTAWRWSAR